MFNLQKNKNTMKILRSVAHFRLLIGLVWAALFSFFALEAAFACDPKTQPCSVIFTLDEQNNLVLQHVEAGARTEGVLRLTAAQAQKAAEGPVSTHNILKAENTPADEFTETIKRLAAIPGLSFLNDPMAVQKAAAEARGDAAKAMEQSGALAGKNQMCAQMHLVMKATLDDATSAAFNPETDYITSPEVIAACGHAAGTRMIEWYETEQLKRRASF